MEGNVVARSSVFAFGKLEIDYTAYGRPHVFRVWVKAFGADSGVGTFVAPSTPASLDALATQLSGLMKPLYNAGSALAFGAWRGLKVTSTSGSTIPIVEGTVTPDTAPSYNISVNPAEGVSQMTASFRDSDSKLVRHVLIGCVYAGSTPFKYSAISGGYKTYVDAVLGSAVMTSLSGNVFDALIDMSFDTNDGLTRRYRR